MQREAPPTEEGWYALHDVRRIDWDAWREATERERRQAVAEGVDFLEHYEAVADAEAGDSAVYTVLGHEADLMIIHLRPTMADLDAAQRAFEGTAFAGYTERADSFVSVTEASGYTKSSREYFEGERDTDSGIGQYIQARLHPDIPDEEFVSFYPMNKRRRPDQNWYDLPFEERADHIERHGDIGRSYGGQVTQMITGAMGLDDWEWGVTLWAADLTDVKSLLTEMRFDQSTSKYADFGYFYVGRRFPPSDLRAVLEGEHVPTDEQRAANAGGEAVPAHPADAVETGGSDDGGHPHDHGERGDGASDEGDPHGESGGGDSEATGGHSHGDDGSDGGRPSPGDVDVAEVEDLDRRLQTLGLRVGADYDHGDYGLLFHSEADAQDLAEEAAALESNFEHYDRHVLTTVRANEGRAAAVSIWTAEDAAETAAGFLGDLSGITERYGGPLGDPEQAETTDDEAAGTDGDDAETVREHLADLDVYAGQPHGEDVYALALYSEADEDDLADAVADLRERFDEHDAHVETAVYGPSAAATAGDADVPNAAVVSLWESQAAADDAGEYLADLPGVVGRVDAGDGFGTMGMFYTVEPEHREDFLATFDDVAAMLEDMDGHRATRLLVDREQDTDMFIASEWDAREDAMEFFRSEAFSDTVEWGRDVLADRPRHVFLA